MEVSLPSVHTPSYSASITPLVGADTPEVQRKLAAILAADVVGYSRLMGADEAGTAHALREHRAALRPIIAGHGGRVVKTTGDGMLLEFPSVVAAVECGIAVQKLMTERNASLAECKRMLFRIGINIGDVLIEGEDIVGDGVNIAARLEEIAEPGGVCLSRAAYDQVRGKMVAEFRDMGEQRLKNIADTVRVYALTSAVGHSASASAPPPDESPKPRISIVVLPFANLSGDPAQEYFADGLTDDLTTELSGWTDTFVIALGTALTLKGRKVDAKSLGRELGVRYLVDGSVRRSNNRIRVAVRLIDAETRSQLWADRFDRDLAELLEMQDEITGRIAVALHYELTDVESDRARAARSNDPDARDLEYRGRAAMHKPSSKETIAEAREYFEQAVRIDNRSVKGWAGLAETHAGDVLGRWSNTPVDQKLRLAEAAAAQAMACDPMNPGAHLARASALFAQTRLEEALEEYGRVIELGRHWPAAYGRMGLLNALLGRPAETSRLVERAISLSPRDGNLGEWYLSIGIASFMMDRLGEAILWLRRSAASNPALGINYLYLASAYSLDGRQQEACAALSEYRRLHPTMTISKLRASPYSNHPAYLAWRERVYEGMRKAGMPE